MSSRKIRQIEKEVEKIKQEIQKIGDMRPGSLTPQYRVTPQKSGPYYQLSYTYNMKSYTKYIRPRFVKQTASQIATYKRFRKLIKRWVTLSIQHSQLKMELEKHKKKR